MKKTSLLILLLTTLCFSMPLNRAKNYNEAIQKAKVEHKEVLLFIYTDFCPWCKKMKNTTFEDKNVLKFIHKNYIFVAINRDKGEYPKEFYPRFIPTTYLIDASTQEEIYALYGYKNAQQFMDELKD